MHSEETESNSIVSYTLQGYEYQRDVTIYLALVLLLERHETQRVTVEPVSGEDFEAAIDAPEHADLTLTQDFPGYKLVVQIKRKSNGPWTKSELKALLNHGKARPSAIKQLEDPKTRFLLLTSEATNRQARPHCVKQVGLWPRRDTVEETFASVLNEGARARFAILSGIDEQRLELELGKLLGEVCRIPAGSREDCLVKLREETWTRMKHGGVWERNALAQIIRDHEGYLASSRSLDLFVPPLNYSDMKDVFRRRNALLISGPSGTGKTTAARHLIETRRLTGPAFRVINVTSMDQISGWTGTEPVLFYVEDPWGKYQASQDGPAWTEFLKRELPSATADRQFVVTTRSDLLVGDFDNRFRVPLEAGHYDRRLKKKMFSANFDRLAPIDQRRLNDRRNSILDELSTPLEIQKFFSHIQDGPIERENDPTFVRRCVSLSLNESIEDGLAARIRTDGSQKVASLVWVILKTQDVCEFNRLLQYGADLDGLGEEFEDELLGFVRQLISGHHLRSSESNLSFMHNRVEFGLEKGTTSKPAARKRVVFALCKAEIEKGLFREAAQILSSLNSIDDRQYALPSSHGDKLDLALCEALSATEPKEFNEALKRLADAGSPTNEAAELARFVLYGEKTKIDESLADFFSWRAPEKEDAFYDRLMGAPWTHKILEGFVEHVLPATSRYYSRSIVTHLERLHPTIDDFAAKLAIGLIGEDPVRNADCLACLAVKDLSVGNPLIIAALEDNPDEYARVISDEQLLALLNHEIDEEYAEHLWDPGYPELISEEVLGRFAELVVQQDRMIEALEHPQAAKLSGYLFKTVGRGKSMPTKVGLKLLASFETDFHRDGFWRELGADKNMFPDDVFIKTLSELPTLAAVKSSVLYAWHSRATPSASLMISNLSDAQILELSAEFADYNPTHGLPPFLKEHWFAALPARLKPACLALADAEGVTLSETDTEQLIEFDDQSDLMLKFSRLRALQNAGQSVSSDLVEILQTEVRVSDDEQELHIAAAEMAVELDDDQALAAGRKSRYARSRALVLKHDLNNGRISPLEMLEYAREPSHSIKRVLVSYLNEQPPEKFVSVLLVLCQDTYASTSPGHVGRAKYPHARSAARQLLNGDIRLAEEPAAKLIEVAKTTHDLRLSIDLFNLALKSSAVSIPPIVLELITNREIHADTRKWASWSLSLRAHLLSESEFEGVSLRDVLKTPPPVAVNYLHCIASAANEEVVLSINRELRERANLGGLHVPLLAGSSDRGALSDAIESQSPAPVVERVKQALSGNLLSRSGIKELGPISVFDFLVQRYSSLFEPDPKD